MSEAHVHGGPECRALFAKLSEYLDRELTSEDCADIDAHLADCPPCQDFLESLRRAVTYVAESRAPELPAEIKREIVSAYERARRKP